MGFPKPLPTQSMKNLFHSPIANRGGLSARLQTPWFVLLACVCLLAAPATHAAPRTWSGSGGDNNWGSAANWGGTA